MRSPQIRSVYGPAFVANYDDVTFRLYIVGDYGFFYWDRIAQIDHDFVLFDVGANQGLYALGAARNPNLRMACVFEPVCATAELLEKNIALNGASEKCTLVRAAVSDTQGTVEIAVKPAHRGGSTISKNKIVSVHSSTERIKTVNRIDLDAFGVPDNLPIYVKVDVEGHEAVVITELLESRLAKRIEEIFYEVDERWIDPDALRIRLEAAGFRTKRIGSNKSHYDVVAVRS